MAAARPELLFVRGPQAGQRVVLTTGQAVLGRSPECDVRLEEESASRRQVQFEMTAEGVVVENLSSQGTLISGKRYKSGKRVLLDTGDVLAAGAVTEILFVAAGDDPEAALTAYRQARPAVGCFVGRKRPLDAGLAVAGDHTAGVARELVRGGGQPMLVVRGNHNPGVPHAERLGKRVFDGRAGYLQD